MNPLSTGSGDVFSALQDILNEKWWTGFYMGAFASWIVTVLVMSSSDMLQSVGALCRKLAK